MPPRDFASGRNPCGGNYCTRHRTSSSGNADSWKNQKAGNATTVTWHNVTILPSCWGLFLKSSETFRAYFGCHNSLHIFATPRFFTFKLRNPLGFSCIENMLFNTSGLQADCSLTTCISGPKSSPDFRETDPCWYAVKNGSFIVSRRRNLSETLFV